LKPARILIVDGYNDEPGGLGVPPYIDVYPRYIAGAAWAARKDVTFITSRSTSTGQVRCG